MKLNKIRDSETIHYTFLFQCKVIEEQASQVIIKRAPEDIELIEQQDQLVTKLQEDMNYIKQAKNSKICFIIFLIGHYYKLIRCYHFITTVALKQN